MRSSRRASVAVLFLETGDFSPAGHRGVHEFLMRLRGFTQFPSLVSGQDRFPQEIEQQGVEGFEAVLVLQIISQQNVLLEKEHIVLAALDKGETIVQNVVGRRGFLAEERLPGSRQAVLLDLHHRLKHVLARLAEHIPAVGLQFGQPRLDHVRLLGMVEMLAAAADPLLGFEHEVRKLRADFLRQELQQGDAKQQVNLDILLVLGVLEPGVQKVGKLALPGGRLRRTRDPAVGLPAVNLPAVRLRAVGLRKESEIGALPDEFQQVCPARFDESGTQKNVVVDVIHPDGQRPQREAQPNRASGSLAQDSPRRAWMCAQP